MRRTSSFCRAWIWASALIFAGCQASPGPNGGAAGGAGDNADSGVTLKAGEGKTLVPQSQPPVKDLPVPIGFDLDVDTSRSYEADQSRLIDHVYRGPAAKDEVRRFYRYNMPLNGWDFRGSQQVGDEVVLRFEKDSQWCEVELRRWNRMFSSGTIIHLTVQTLIPPGKTS